MKILLKILLSISLTFAYGPMFAQDKGHLQEKTKYVTLQDYLSIDGFEYSWIHKTDNDYSLGEVITIQGEPCIVIRSNAADTIGIALSLRYRDTTEKWLGGNIWGPFSGKKSWAMHFYPIGDSDFDSGIANYINLAKSIDRMSYSLDQCYAIYLPATIGDGWFLPSKGELNLLYDLVPNLPKYAKIGKKHRYVGDLLQKHQKDLGLKRKNPTIASSTEYNHEKIYVFNITGDVSPDYHCHGKYHIEILPAHLFK